MKYITRPIWILSIVSLFTDMASEMLYPVMPIYLESIGFTILLIGILEGLAEATAGLSKGYFGKRSDLTQKRVPFVQLGYTMSAISKPLMVAFVTPLWIFFARTIDRFGKGIRTGARDAILSEEATPETKGRIFGFHRSMDTLGAVLGPSIALIYLYFYPENYKTLFLIAFLPGLVAILSTLLLKENRHEVPKPIKRQSFFSFLRYWKESPATYRKVVFGLLLFAIINSSDVFLLLMAKQSGMNDTAIIGVYIFYNLIYALFAFPLGILADKIGIKRILLIGIGIFSIVYFGMSFTSNSYLYLFFFFLYGIYAAATEGVSKAWISNISDKKDTATAIGTYAGLQSIFALIASSLTGFIWYQFNATAALLTSAIGSVLIIVYFLVVTKDISAKKIESQ